MSSSCMMEMYKKVLYTLRGVCICIEHKEAIDRCSMFMCNIMRKGRLLENIQLGGQNGNNEGRGLKPEDMMGLLQSNL